MEVKPVTRTAWTVANSEEHQAVVVFAESEQQAAKTAAWELATDPEGLEVERSPEWDSYAGQGWVPVKVLIDAGWRWSCEWCDREINDEYWDYEQDRELNPVFAGSRAFCSSGCCLAHMEDRLAYRLKREAAIAAFKEKFPWMDRSRFSIWLGGDAPEIEFKPEGFTSRVQWRMSDPDHVWVHPDDVDRYKEWKLAHEQQT